MKVKTIGRELDNDIVVNDGKVSRYHLKIVYDGGRYRIIDLNSSNGTFVNGHKITGETELYEHDVVRIGNTHLQWQTYFPRRRGGGNAVLYSCVAGLFAVLFVVGVFVFNANRQTHVKMVEKGGVRCVPMKINGQELDFVFDTGASSICISSLEAVVLIKNGTLNEFDIIGKEQFMDASGRISVGTRINLKTIELAGRTLYDIEATVVENPSAVCLLGQTVLSRFGKYTIDNQKNEIIFE